MWTLPPITTFKNVFFRDFNYASADNQNDLTKIVDRDLNNAFALANSDFNPCMGFSTDADTLQAFLYLAAYYLVENLRLSSKGLASQANFPISSVGAGGVNVSYQIPKEFQDFPEIAKFAKNGYGLLYLQLVIPYIRGGVGWLPGGTL